MKTRHWLAIGLVVVAVIGVIGAYRLPELARRIAIARLQAATGRPVEIAGLDLHPLRGRASLRGLRIVERDGQPFASVERLDVSVRPLPLLIGRLHLREVTVRDSAVSVVRRPDGTFNFSDLVGRGGPAGPPPSVTVDHFVVMGSKVTLEDRGVAEPQTWVSERIEIDAHDLSTRADRGRAIARSITAGTPVTIELSGVRLHPIHLQARVTTEGLDLGLARVYLPPGAELVPARGRVSTVLTAALDAREGLRGDLTVRLEDVALARPGGGEPLALAPRVVTRIEGFAFRDGAVRVDRLALDGAMSVRDPAARGGQRFRSTDVKAGVTNLTWPATTPGQLDLTASVPGGGALAVTGTLRPPSEPSELRVRLADVDLAPWAQLLPIAARIRGVAQADLRMNEPLAAGIPARVQGAIAINRVAVADDRHELLAARRIEASGLSIRIPDGGRTPALRIGQLLVSEPRAVVERDRSGEFPLTSLVRRPDSAVSTPPSPSTSGPAVSPVGVEIGEIVVRNGALAWHDGAVSPPARLDVSGIDARVTGIGLPLRGPADARLDLRSPGGGRLRLAGRVGLDPLSADVRVSAERVELAPYRPYLPVTAQVAGAVDLDLAVVVPSLDETRATVRGSAALSRVDVRDGERTVMRLERGVATGLDVDWPRRIAVERLALTRPWVLVERDAKGELPLRPLLTPHRAGTPSAPATAAEPVAVTVASLRIADGGARVVDQKVSPPFAVDLQSAAVTMDGLSTSGSKPARLELNGRLGPGSALTLNGTVGPLGGPLRVDLSGELRDFALPRTNPYLLQQVGWKTAEGRLSSKLQCRVEGDALSAKTEIRLGHLQLVRAAEHDEARARMGLPLNMITSLMKNKQGDIVLSFPVGGRLSDPRFDFREAVWGAVRAVTIHAITLPVSWIGRVRFTGDSRIERIDVDPVTFEAGLSTLTEEGRTQLARLTAFLDQLPEVRLALTPMVSSRDLLEVRRRALEATLEQLANRHRLSRDAAVARLYAERFSERPAPTTSAAALSALVEEQPVASSVIGDLGGQRLGAVRDALKRAGVHGERLAEREVVQREGRQGEVDLDVIDPETPRPSKVREVMRRLGMPVAEGAGKR